MLNNFNGLLLNEIMPSTTVAGCIDIFENLWPVHPDDTINELETLCENSNETGVYWSRAHTIGSGAYQNIRTNKLLPITHLAEITENRVLQSIHNMFYTSIQSTIVSYMKRYGINESLQHEGFQILKYEGGEEYKAHYDGLNRVVSCLIYLNDDYEGGELEFPFFKIKIKPQKGMMILFPSNYAYTHIAHPVTRGTKYCLVTWSGDINRR